MTETPFWLPEISALVTTENLAMQKIFEKVRSVAPTKATVLLTGETGTGKSLLAKILHQHSSRPDKPFISVHCGAIPDNLVESELFGHEKGSFTGAYRKKIGKFEVAHGGTIFLDEVTTMPPAAQIKLLNVLQDRTFQRIGGHQDITVDVRIVAATNMNIQQLSENGSFRSDLFYRLNVFPIQIPPLRERGEDIPILLHYFLRRFSRIYGKEIQSVEPRVVQFLSHYSWPGNIRELENLIERATILEMSPALSEDSFPAEFFTFQGTGEDAGEGIKTTLAEVRKRGIENIERRYLRELLAENRGRIDTTAKIAGISTRQLHKLLKKYEINKKDFKYLPPLLKK